MNGPHDLGGQMGHGPVTSEADEPWFHADWEKKALALTLAMGATGSWNIDTSRHARECLPPLIYLGTSYYEIWLRALVNLMISHDMVTEDELTAGHYSQTGKTVKRVLKADAVAAALAKGSPCDRPCESVPLFKAGDIIRCSNDSVVTHTRMPSYVRNATGVIIENHGAFVYPDSNAHGGGENPIWCYAVRFKATDLWGKTADPHSEVMVDLFEPYLEKNLA
jgi:nitrile hydratase subunit beta